MSDEIDVGYLQANRYSLLKDTIVYKKSALDSRGQFATAMIERWGMVAAIEDGEDSAGRHKIRLSTPTELVQRACEVSNLAYEEFEKRGWILKLPIPTLEKDK